MALEDLKPGLTGEVHRRVSKAMLTSRAKSLSGGVLSTPSMIGLMEWAAITATDKFLPEGLVSVGYHVDVRHLAPTPHGMKVTIKAVLTEVNGNRLTFKVEAYNELTKIGAGIHRRAIIPLKPLELKKPNS